MTSIFHAAIESRNFSFEGFGSTAEEAVGALENAWNEHARQYRAGGRHVPLFDEPYEEDGTQTVREYFDVEAKEFELGQGYRDREPIGDKVTQTKRRKNSP